MSAIWPEGEAGDGDEVSGRAWSAFDDAWDFDALNEHDGQEWSAWDYPAQGGAHMNDTSQQEPFSSSTFDGSPPPSLPQDRQPRQNYFRSYSPPPNPSILPSTPHMGNTSSSINYHQGRPRGQADTASRSNHDRIPHQPPNHSEDWLDLTTAGRQGSFRQVGEGFGSFEEGGTPASRSSDYFDGIDIDDLLSEDEEELNMPPKRRTGQSREGFVDLTNEPSSPAQPQAGIPTSLKRRVEAAAQGSRASKRSRRSSPSTKTEPIDELDLTNEAPSVEDELLQQAQQQAIAAQQSSENTPTGPVKIGQRTCIICMEAFTNATVTRCGHVYCHECLSQALIAGEKNSDRGTSNCPVCRNKVDRAKANHVIPINFMKKSAFKGKKRRDLALLA